MKRVYVVPTSKLGRRMTSTPMGNEPNAPPIKQGSRETQRRARQLKKAKGSC